MAKCTSDTPFGRSFCSVRFRYELSSCSVTTTVSALPEPLGFVRPRFSIDASFLRERLGGRRRQGRRSRRGLRGQRRRREHGHEHHGHRFHVFIIGGQRPPVRTRRAAGFCGSTFRTFSASARASSFFPISKRSVASSVRTADVVARPERHPQLGRRLLAVPGRAVGARQEHVDARGVGVEVDRAGELARGPRVVARLREPLGAAEQSRHHLGTGPAAPVVGECPLGDAHALEAPRRIRAVQGLVRRRQRQHRLPLLLRLRLAAPLAQRPHEDRARVAVQRVLLEHRAQLLLRAREVALPQERPAQVEREVDGARLRLERPPHHVRRLRVRPASREAQERHRLVVQRGGRGRGRRPARRTARPPRDSGRARSRAIAWSKRAARACGASGGTRASVSSACSNSRAASCNRPSVRRAWWKPGDSPSACWRSFLSARGVAGRERAPVRLQRGRRDERLLREVDLARQRQAADRSRGRCPRPARARGRQARPAGR